MRSRRRWLLGFGAVLLVAVGPLLWQLLQLTWTRHAQQRRLQQLKAFHQQLTEERGRLTEDPVYVEGLIRSTFKVAKPGELVIPKESRIHADRHADSR